MLSTQGIILSSSPSNHRGVSGLGGCERRRAPAMKMDTLMAEMVKYLKVAQVQARRALAKCDQALAECAKARQHLDKLRVNYNEVKGVKK